MTEKNIDHYSFHTSDVLGVGSFGTVFQGIDLKNNRYVALKMIAKDNLLNDPKGKSGLMTEIKIMKKLNHKNIVQLIDVLETQNNFYIIQELCENGDLSKFLKKNRQVDEKMALNIIINVLEGFYELLKYRIIHRDLKPANILIHNNTYKLADFGFAKIVDNFNPNVLHSQVGTPLYMSPQILRNEQYSMKCDIWSLGFLFYEMLYGQSPWTAQSIPQLVKNIYTQPLVFHDSINQVSDNVKDFITKCLIIQEDERLSWQDVYHHPVFAQYFVQDPKVENLFEEKELSIAMSMREQFGTQQLSINELLRELAEDENKILNIEGFSEIFLAINENLEDEEIQYIFNCIDEESNGQITCENLLDWLNKYDISLEDTYMRSGSNTVYGAPEKKQIQQGLQQNELNQDRQLIQILYDEIKTNNLNLVELFHKFATTSDIMNYQDFTNMMLNYDTTLSDWEIFETFKLFAQNKSDNINLNQFKQVLEQNFQDDYF
ncbi:unnamed protein product [Paramecium primaurelia]|uniref:Calcium-dependent protein kinase n=1 Tax=Paramecium primaurelia TaxID=5886 RepID=A0A8S1JNC4_PARPR|nr:unnamed protein product [Paramecium primaurelia]